MVIADNFLERGRLRNSMCREAPRLDRRFDTAFVESAVGPVSRNSQIVVGIVEWRDTVLDTSGTDST